MMVGDRVITIVVVIAANYYITTFSIWFGHWFSHLKKSPLAPFHVSGHHVFYPSSQSMLSQQFIYGSGISSRIFALLPWLLLQTLVQFLLLPWWKHLSCLAEEILIVIVFNYLHTQFHLLNSRLEKFFWFRRARDRHALHHDWDVNYMVGDHLWDRVLGTYLENKILAERVLLQTSK